MLKYKTKPLELPKAVDEIWEILEMQDEIIQILLQRLNAHERRLIQLETSDEADTARLD